MLMFDRVLHYSETEGRSGEFFLTVYVSLYEDDNHIEIHTYLNEPDDDFQPHSQGIEGPDGLTAYFREGRNASPFMYLKNDGIAFVPHTAEKSCIPYCGNLYMDDTRYQIQVETHEESSSDPPLFDASPIDTLSLSPLSDLLDNIPIMEPAPELTVELHPLMEPDEGLRTDDPKESVVSMHESGEPNTFESQSTRSINNETIAHASQESESSIYDSLLERNMIENARITNNGESANNDSQYSMGLVIGITALVTAACCSLIGTFAYLVATDVVRLWPKRGKIKVISIDQELGKIQESQ